MRVEYAIGALKDLKSLDRPVAAKIVKKILLFSSTEDPLQHAKLLTGNLSGLYRFRIGDYRVIFSIDGDGVISVLTILTIAHRKDVYRL